MMDPAAYGLIALSMAVILAVSALSGLGLQKLLVQLETAGKIETDTAFALSSLAGLILALLLWWLAPLMAELSGTPQLATVMKALVPLVILKALTIVPLGLLIRDFRFKAVALRSILAQLVGGAAGIALALNGFGVWALVAQELVRATTALVTLWLASDWRPGLSASPAVGRVMLGSSLNILGSEITRIAHHHLDRFLIGSFLGVISLGVYTIASKVNRVAVTVLHDSLSRVGLPTFSRARAEPTELRSIYYRSQALGSAVTLPIFVLLMLTADLVVPLLLGQQWQSSVTVLKALCIASCAASIGVFNSPLLLAVGRGDIVFRFSLFKLACGVAAFLVSVHWGVLGVSLAFALREWLVLPLELKLCQRYSPIEVAPVWRGTLGLLLTLMPMALVVVGIQHWGSQTQSWLMLFNTLLSGAACYLVTLLVVKRELAMQLFSVASILRTARS